MRQALEFLASFSNSVDADTLARKLRIPQSNARRVLLNLQDSGAVTETTGLSRGQMFSITPEGKKALTLSKRLSRIS
jgi:predicted ArsR family transcriptional regulator